MGLNQPPYNKSERVAKQQTADRLANALRDNLHRRKAQARARNRSKIIATTKTIQSDDSDCSKL